MVNGTVLELHPDGLTVSRLPGVGVVEARPHDDDEYRARAVALGYGADTLAMSRDHELVHSLLAGWLGLPESPTLRGVADQRFWPHWQAEEAAVLGVQRFARMAGVDLVGLAERRPAGRRENEDA